MRSPPTLPPPQNLERAPNRPSLNLFDGVILWHDFDYENQSGDDKQIL